MPLAECFVEKGCYVKLSTTSSRRVTELSVLKVNPFIIDIGVLTSNIQPFLQANILIINIPVKNVDYFASLIEKIEASEIKKVLFVSSISVYENNNLVISESDGLESKDNSLFKIENLFRQSSKFKTTIIRFGGLIGYSRNPGKFFSKGKPVYNPDGNVNLIHRDDCIEIISQIIEQDVWGDVFNCCADTHPTKRQFYTQVSIANGFPSPTLVNSSKKSFKIISNQKVKTVLNYDFLHADLMNMTFNGGI